MFAIILGWKDREVGDFGYSGRETGGAVGFLQKKLYDIVDL